MTQDTWTEITADDKPARAKHTPGPWNISFESIHPEWAVVTASGGKIVANVNSESGPNIYPLVATQMPRDANAKLIAAAPTMLAVLHQVSRHFAILAAHGTPVDVTLEDAVHEAIDAAGGY